MKAIIRVLVVIAGVTALSCAAPIQALAASGSAVPFAIPATVVKNGDMKLNNILVSGEGTVTVSPAGALSTGGVSIARANAATFTISGQPGYMFAITLPASGQIIYDEEHGMSITDYTSSPRIGSLNDAGTQVIQVGATLHMNTAQPEGSYANATELSVTVNYN